MEQCKSKRTALPVSSLMSPPESAPYENFFQGYEARSMLSAPPAETQTIPLTLFTPPVSPEVKSLTAEKDNRSGGLTDPILYPIDNASTTSSQEPLFDLAPAERKIVAKLIEEHISTRSPRKFRKTTPPRVEDYALAMAFKSDVYRQCALDPRGWLAREKKFLIEGDRLRRAYREEQEEITRQRMAQPIAPPTTTTVGIKRTYPALAPSPTGVSKPKPRATVSKPRTPKVRDLSATPEGTPHRSRNTGTSTREDKDFNSIPDYCPPVDAVILRPNSMRVEWKGNPLDLSNDPNCHLLHPEEVQLASVLRLDCATYLTSKRRIFQARLECYLGRWGGGGRGKKEFRKTDAQQACKIDVNKASKLWQVYEKVGWLDERFCVGKTLPALA